MVCWGHYDVFSWREAPPVYLFAADLNSFGVQLVSAFGVVNFITGYRRIKYTGQGQFFKGT
jgi:hypothetical protein